MLPSKTVSAARLFKDGKYADALEIYQQLSDEIGREFFAANLKICRSRLMAAEYGGSIKKRRKHNVRVACVMDEFTFGSYREECELMQLTPAGWLQELDEFRPELVFIESAWRGKDDLWGSKVGHNSDELRGILRWSKENSIPSVFWNKEDPVHFSTFLTSASQFDFVFTTDIDCVPRYKKALGHERVYFLPFACQPAVHNPIELYARKDAFCFAGAYYVKYPERTKDLEGFVSELPKFKALEIYDRNFGKDNPDYKFPEQYEPYIVGTLAFDEIDRAYKGYHYAINLNSIKQSQSMFARRVYELLASNTYTISNFSRGLRLMFGDLVLSTDSGQEARRRLFDLSQKKHALDKIRLRGLRKVFSEHTYQDRLDYILNKVFGSNFDNHLPKVTLFAKVNNLDDLDNLYDMLSRQSYQNFQVYVLDGRAGKKMLRNLPSKFLLLGRGVRKKLLGSLADANGLIGYLSPEDYYGPNYLKDLVLTDKYIDVDVVQKGRLFVFDGTQVLSKASDAYVMSSGFSWRKALVKSAVVSNVSIEDFFLNVDELTSLGKRAFVIDGFNYCENGVKLNFDQQEEVNDIPLNDGLPLTQLQSEAERELVYESSEDCESFLSPARLSELFKKTKNKNIDFIFDHGFKLVSHLSDGKHEYLFASEDVVVDELSSNGELRLHLDVEPGLNLQVVAFFLDSSRQRFSHTMAPAGRNLTAQIPEKAVYIKFGFRVYGSGSSVVKKIVLGHKDQSIDTVFTTAKTLLITNNYPSYELLYRNGFVHSRVRTYKEFGKEVDVFRFRSDATLAFDEFNDVDVISGDAAVLDKILSQGRYETVLVHFMDRGMWDVLKNYVDSLKVIVWVHGADIQPLHRRNFDFVSDVELERLQLRGEERLGFWRGVLDPMPNNLKVVFVSKSFAEDVFEDLGFRIPENKYEIIHNPIDTDLFSYKEKTIEHRKKILSIRPYSSRLYANDLTVAVIEKLSKELFFNELEFRIIGDGKLFDEVTAPLREFDNVRIEQRFLNQIEIAELHKEYGIFMCPSRTDTQGVSRDEAMSSGLVPVTNSSGAIPEFLDNTQGILVAPEDVDAMVQGIKYLYENSDSYLLMSAAASERVRGQSGKEVIMPMEMALF